MAACSTGRASLAAERVALVGRAPARAQLGRRASRKPGRRASCSSLSECRPPGRSVGQRKLQARSAFAPGSGLPLVKSFPVGYHERLPGYVTPGIAVFLFESLPLGGTAERCSIARSGEARGSDRGAGPGWAASSPASSTTRRFGGACMRPSARDLFVPSRGRRRVGCARLSGAGGNEW